MMISPNAYIEEKKDWNLDKLYKEKESLEKYIYDYENENLRNKDKDIIIVSPSPAVVASMYKDYLEELNCLIAQKEKNKEKVKYKQYTQYEDLIKLIEEKDNFFASKILEIYNEDGKARINIQYEDIEYCFYFEGVTNFKIELYDSCLYVFEINLQREEEKLVMNFDGTWINITAEKIKIETIDVENTTYTYASIKYKEEQDKTFYYISNIEDLKIGDYVWVSVRNEQAPGIVANIEKFAYNNVPFPIKITKTIIRKSTRQEYEQYHRNKAEEKSRMEEAKNNYESEEKEDLDEKCRKLPFIKTQKVEWSKGEKLGLLYPKYDEEVLEWIQAFYDLDLIDKDYKSNYEEIEGDEIETLSQKEILTYLTYIIRKDHFCEGTIADNLENGIIERLELALKDWTLKLEEITDDNIDRIKSENILFFSFAESGAMGEPCGIVIVTEENNEIHFYRTNYATEISIKKLFPVFPTLETLGCAPFGIVTGVQDGFIHVSTGLGNHLFVNEKINEEFQENIKLKSEGEIYRDWRTIVLKMFCYKD